MEKSLLVHEGLSRQIIGSGMTVLNALGPGLDEKHYQNSLIIEMISRGLTVEQEKEFPVHYKGHCVGKLRPDLIVQNQVIVETKVVECFHDRHIAQVLSYLAITRLELGLLLNFKHAKLEWKRLVRSDRLRSAAKESHAGGAVEHGSWLSADERVDG